MNRPATSLCLLLALASWAYPGAAQTRQPYEGLWAGNAAQCRDPDGVERMEISGQRFFWYETRCTVRSVSPAGPRAWAFRMACEGEGERWSARPRVSLPNPSRLVMENSPVGPTKRQVYVRCRL